MNPLPRRRHLTDDEVIWFPGRTGQEIPYRLRIWRGDVPSDFVIVSHVVDKESMWPGPSMLTAKVANFVNAAYLGYPCAFLYFEDEWNRRTGLWELSQVSFDEVGCFWRTRLAKPERKPREWGYIEHLAYGPVER